MAIKADDLIRLRNEGMAYALKVAKEHGVEGLERQVMQRGLYKVAIQFTEEEYNKSLDNISERVYNNMLTMAYAVLHDACGYGEKRLKKFKELFDRKVYLVGEYDPAGKHYARFEDYAAEANRLYNLGIDMEVIKQTQFNNDSGSRKYVAVDEIVRWLKSHGHAEAAEAVKEDAFDQGGKHLTKKQRKAAECRRDSDRHNKYYMDDACEENIEYWFNVFGLALAQNCGFTAGQIHDIWKTADGINGRIADGTATLRSVKEDLLESSGTMCEFTRGGKDYAEAV